ncbi:hypothetical protein TGFOU_269670B, partial [Toxoplasma gondii FOU]
MHRKPSVCGVFKSVSVVPACGCFRSQALQTRSDLESELAGVRQKLEQREAELALAVQGRFLAAEALQQLRLFQPSAGRRSLSLGPVSSSELPDSSPVLPASPRLQSLSSAPQMPSRVPRRDSGQTGALPSSPRGAEVSPSPGALNRLSTQSASAVASVGSQKRENSENENPGKVALFPGDLGTIHVSPLQLSPVSEGHPFAFWQTAPGRPPPTPGTRLREDHEEMPKESREADRKREEAVLRQWVCAAWQLLARQQGGGGGDAGPGGLPCLVSGCARRGDEAESKLRDFGDTWPITQRKDVTEEDVARVIQALM